MIQFLDLKKINSQYNKELFSAAERVINSGWYISGEEVEKFEINLKNFIRTKFAVGVGNGLDALKLILKAYIENGFLRPGDEVLVPSNTFIATVMAITENNLIPVFVEPNQHTFNLEFNNIKEKITNKSKAIILVHLYGKTCWNIDFLELKSKYNLIIIEDNAQAFGGCFVDDLGTMQMTGSLGDVAAFSFYPGKNLGALGDAGAITTNDEFLANTIKALSNYGSYKKYEHAFIGYNSRLDEIQAAFLNVKIKYLMNENLIRRKIANLYLENIKLEIVKLPKYDEDERQHVWHLFVIKCKERNDLSKYLNCMGIQTLIHYPIPIHKQHAYKIYNNLKLDLTVNIHKEILSLPISSVMDQDEVFRVIDGINSF
uniref:DegT/DnrJ/EryC1/StrS family aminotransferase n=1 Tax=Algoriphagus sp. TaxID=1872435 RepID=UPI0040475ECC